MLRLSKRQKETRKVVATTQVEMLEERMPTHSPMTRVVEVTTRVTPATHSRMTLEAVTTPVAMLVAEKMPTHSLVVEMTPPETLAVEMQVVEPPLPMLVEAMQQPIPIPQRESPHQNPL
jgi:hypothetical protein